MYLMETFLPYTLSKAERNKDISKIQTLGPFADALFTISLFAQLLRKDLLDP